MLELRRTREAERLQRIKDPAMRNAIDTAALDAQVKEKAAIKAEEQARDKAYDDSRLYVDQQLVYLEQERRAAVRATMADMNDFRQTLQTKPNGRDFDLNDPNALKADVPARCGDDDPRLSVSGLQKFHGEDLGHAYKVKAQREEIAAANSALAAEKAAAKASMAAEDAAYSNSMLMIDGMKVQLEAAAADARSQTNRAVAQYNQAQAAAKCERERALKVNELQQNVEEIQAQLSGTTLTEDPIVGRSYIAPNRLRPDHYKGMSAEEKALVYDEQAAQRTANDSSKAQAAADKAASDATVEDIRLARCAGETRVAAMRAEMRKSVMLENRELAQSQAATKAFVETKVYPNEISPEFFDQFNTTAR